MTSLSPSLSQIAKSRSCAGCGLCAALSQGSVEMAMSDDGYLRPQQRHFVPEKVERLISETCPGLNLSQLPSEQNHHMLWGPMVGVRSGASTDIELRRHASSGGVISGLLLYLLEAGVVDYILQTAADSKHPLGNMTVRSANRDDIYKAAGSRYAPSAPLSDILTYLERPGKFALVAKPCDIAAVRALAKQDPRIDKKIPIMISFFCAGIPSEEGARAILDELNVDEKEVTSFKYRGDGWPGFATATLKNGNKKSMSYASSWGNILSKHVQFRCKICPDGSGGSADIVCADAWHSDDLGYPLFEEKKGRSLIISRTEFGETTLKSAEASGFISTQSLDIEEIAGMQPSQAQRKRFVLSRLAAMRLLGKPTPNYKGFELKKAALSGGLWPNFRNFLGTARRIIAGKW